MDDRAAHGPEPPLVVIEPSRGWAALRVVELYDYRELLFFLTWRDIKVRYQQTVLGVLWAILQPLMTMLVFTVFFGRLAKVPSDGLPYPLFALAGLIPWTFFSYGINQSANSLVASANLIKKVYFPRLIAPLAAIFAGAVDLLFSVALLGLMMAYYGIGTGWRCLWALPFFCLAFITAVGVGLWLSALNVEYRDVRHVVPFLVQFWMYATPIVYPSSLLSEQWRVVFGLNPMAGVVEGFRWALLGAGVPPGPMMLVSVSVALGLFVSGAFYFRRMERTFADVV